MKQRGLVLSESEFDLGNIAEGNRGSITTSPKTRISPEELRRFILYWDKIDLPRNNRLITGLSPELEYLKNVGFLEQTSYTVEFFNSSVGFKILAETLKQRNEQNPGGWAILQKGYDQTKSVSDQDTRTVEVELYGLLPVPPSDTPFDEILDFKEKRRSELYALRIHMDELYQGIASSADLPRAKDTAIIKLQRSLGDLHKVSRERWSLFKLSNMKAEIKLSDVAIGALVGASVASPLGFPLALGSILGAAQAMIRVDLGCYRNSDWIPDEIKDFAYSYQVNKDFNKN